MVFNWRGPVLAAGIFATVFAVLLLMAHQNQSNTSDMGSSLREDPYGTSLLFDSYRRAGYQVMRSQDEDSLSDQNALRTTAFFIGGYSADDWSIEKRISPSNEKLRARLEDFLARGGRAVLVAPAQKLKSESQGWQVENKWEPSPEGAGPAWISADSRTMPEGSDANADSPVHVYMAMRSAGHGELIAASQESFLLNEAIKTRPNPALLDFLAGGRPMVWVDETLHGLHQDEGVLWLVRRYRLQAALLLFWATLLVLLWSLSGDLVRRPMSDQSTQVMRHSEGAGVAGRRLLQRSIAPEQVVADCWEEFRRRSPQDAQAISRDPHFGPRLQAALCQPPLPGYKQLSQLVAERRASARGLARPNRGTPGSSTSSQNKGPEEARLT
jgi:hypothetical protein